MVERIICTASRLSTAGSCAKGRLPALAWTLAIAASSSSAALTPPTPKRIAAQPTSGIASTIGVEGTIERLSRTVGGPNTTMPAAVSATASATASTTRRPCGGRCRLNRARPPSRMAGTTPSSVRTLANMRARKTFQ